MVEAKSIEVTARPTYLLRSNYYSSLWLEDLNPDLPRWQYELEVRREEGDNTCLESVPVTAATSVYVVMVTPVTMTNDKD